MADAITGVADFSDLFKGFDAMSDNLRVSVARTMGVAAGVVLRDEAKLLAPEGSPDGGSITPGLLKSAMYVAYRPALSVNGSQVYSVSWNKKKAPHGHFLEFGFWETVPTYKAKDGEWYSNPTHTLAKPKWRPPHAFLQPAYHSSFGRMRDAMLKAGRARILELHGDPDAAPDES
jgi:hypothetical protein